MRVKLIYFAWLREKIGVSEEMRDIPADVRTAHDLLVWLATQSEDHAAALAVPSVIRVAVDQEMIMADEFIGTPQEIALFPPMTGG
ncbi:MAG: molybdopterin converting factor subunit 1 [Rhizobiaceae bacterium]|jgi:molybdopterin synthase sulfur carrier subunit|nr:molybdopterin converting factor subunit 1 [Rhizobiaceae bacterium]